MRTANFMTSSCRYCRYYQAEGRRGGVCNQLSVPVRGEWKACTLAARPFAAAWQSLDDLVRLEQSLALAYNSDNLTEEITEEINEAIPLKATSLKPNAIATHY